MNSLPIEYLPYEKQCYLKPVEPTREQLESAFLRKILSPSELKMCESFIQTFLRNGDIELLKYQLKKIPNDNVEQKILSFVNSNHY